MISTCKRDIAALQICGLSQNTPRHRQTTSRKIHPRTAAHFKTHTDTSRRLRDRVRSDRDFHNCFFEPNRRDILRVGAFPGLNWYEPTSSCSFMRVSSAFKLPIALSLSCISLKASEVSVPRISVAGIIARHISIGVLNLILGWGKVWLALAAIFFRVIITVFPNYE